MYHASRQPHPDLPAIPEEASTPASSTQETPVEADEEEDETEEIDFACGDDSSNAESYANNSIASYAFTLDNVGFDEENSLVGSVVGSVAGASGAVMTAVHTPPSDYSPGRISKHERKLHRESCRALGLPYSEDSSPSSGSENKDDSIFGDTSISSGSADELDRKRKMDKLWPWPTKTGDAMPLDKMETNVNLDDKPEPSSNSRLGKITETTSTFTNKMKEAISSFNKRIEEAYEASKQKAMGNDDGKEATERASNVNQNRPLSFDTKPKRIRSLLLHPSWANSYKNANSMTKLTVGTTILFMLLCIVMILATLAVSKSSGSEPSWNDDGTEIISDLDRTSIDLGGSVDIVPTAAPSSAEIAAVTKSPTSLPSYSPTVTPTVPNPAAWTETNVSNEPCVDKDGKFRNARGKRRECHWLTIHSPYELYTTRLDAECGAVGERGISELASNCRYTCRGYNGCPLSGESEGMVLVEKEDEAEDSSSSVSLVQPALDGTVPETNSPTDSSPTNHPTVYAVTDAPTSFSPTGKPSMDLIVESPAVTVAIERGVDDTNLPTFIDVRGRERQCWWLDIRNAAQREIRRDANCVNEVVQATCPSSCIDYVKMAVMNGQAANGAGILAMSQAATFAGTLGGNNDNTDADADDANEGSVTNIDDIMAQSERSDSPVLLQATLASVEMLNMEPPQDMCSDEPGYYLNHHGQPKQCSWLINDQDPTDETRRIRNCGYDGSEYPEGTDLGRMCKSTCGTCGL